MRALARIPGAGGPNVEGQRVTGVLSRATPAGTVMCAGAELQAAVALAVRPARNPVARRLRPWFTAMNSVVTLNVSLQRS